MRPGDLVGNAAIELLDLAAELGLRCHDMKLKARQGHRELALRRLVELALPRLAGGGFGALQPQGAILALDDLQPMRLRDLAQFVELAAELLLRRLAQRHHARPDRARN